MLDPVDKCIKRYYASHGADGTTNQTKSPRIGSGRYPSSAQPLGSLQRNWKGRNMTHLGSISVCQYPEEMMYVGYRVQVRVIGLDMFRLHSLYRRGSACLG